MFIVLELFFLHTYFKNILNFSKGYEYMGFISDIEIKAIKHNGKDFFEKDKSTKNLFLHIKANSRLWVFRYTDPISKKQKTLSFGAYPIITLQKARLKALEAQRLISEGIDPLQLKRDKKLEQLQKIEFDKFNKETQIHLVFNEWCYFLSSKYQYEHIKKLNQRFNKYVLPHFAKYNNQNFVISSLSIDKISQKQLTHILELVSKEAPHTAKRLYQELSKLWLFAIGKEYTNSSPLLLIDTATTLQNKSVKHMPKITDLNDLKALFRAIDSYSNNIVIRCLLQFVSHIPLRAKTLSSLQWDFIDFEKRLLTIPRNEMKTKNENLPPFKVPLTSQAIEILKELYPLTNNSKWIFCNLNQPRHHINQETPNGTLIKFGYGVEPKKQTLHSFRGTFRSLANTYQHIHKAPIEVREAVLDHHKETKTEMAYTHQSDYTEQMKPLLEWWSDFIDDLKKG